MGLATCEGVWVVVFSNYYPPEVDSLWTTEKGANDRVDELNQQEITDYWHAQWWRVEEADEE